MMKSGEADVRDRIMYVRSLYTPVGERSFFGPQGTVLSTFIEEACPLREVAEANLDKLSSRRTNDKHKGLFNIKTHYEAPEPTSKVKHIHSTIDILQLTDTGVSMLNNPGVANTVVYCLQLRCAGGTSRGESSGSNCRRVPCKFQWCSGVGSCDEHCAWLFLPEKERDHARLQHMCSFSVTLEATLIDIQKGIRQITISGNHGYENPADWKSPDRRRRAEHFRQSAIKIGATLSGPSRSNLLDCINSPSGKDSRSYMTRTQFGRSVEYHKHGEIAYLCSIVYHYYSITLFVF